jgi:short-subunit dehydrogenase
MGDLASLPNVTLLAHDVTSRSSIDEAAAAVKKETGGTLDVLVNNAGMAYSTPSLDADVKTVRDLFDVNFFGTLETTIAFAPLVVAAKGTIVNICSTAGVLSLPWMGVSSPPFVD